MSSSHPDAGQLLRQGLFRDLTAFEQFERRLRNLATTKEVGDAFEILVEAYVHTQPKMQATNVWLVGKVPLRIRKRLNLPSDSKGIDGIFETRAGELVPYQVKYRTDRNVLPYGEVSSFLGITERSCKDRVIFTNARGLSKDVENRDGLRSVRASHFHALTKDDFAAIEAWLAEKPVRHEKRQPRPYQQEAVQKLSEALRERSRATAVMACGAGKTLVALWAAEALEPKTVLVLVPSLALLSQTLPDWCRESKWGESLEYLCVCSDPTVSKGIDAYTIRPQDADFPITTDPKEVRRFLERKTKGVKVVFSTYQSAPVVAKGMKGLKPFDFAVFDEAHKTTGPQDGLFAFGLTDKNLPIAKRLFLTATPRHYDICNKRDKEGDFRLVSMDDETVYGPVAYRLSFASAVKQGIICPYKIVISVTIKADVDAALLKHGSVLVKREANQAQWVATQLALQSAIRKTKASKVITFHSRVALAEQFASDRSSGVSQHLKGFEVFHVNGEQSAADRESLLTDFKTSNKGVITNARCLTEGVDVPAVDMVAFIDPRRSKVDIAQATGRAMRQSKATGKTTGYIVVPLFLEQKKGESEEAALKRSGFEDVATVVAAMLEQDEDLVEVIGELRQEKGEGKPFNPRKLMEKLEVIGPSISLQELRKAVSVAVVDRLGTSWDEMFGKTVAYSKEFGNCRVPQSRIDSDGSSLGTWVAHQRQIRERLSPDRRSRLDALKGWAWDALDTKWEEGFDNLVRYCEENGDCRLLAKHITNDGFRLGVWVGHQRHCRDTMPIERTRRLESLNGWHWDHFFSEWEEKYKCLRRYCDENGTSRVPQSYRLGNGLRLGTWVTVQRRNKDSMSLERRKRLESLPHWAWDSLSAAWDDGLSHLQRYLKETGGCLVPDEYKTADGFALGKWVGKQRQKASDMTAERVRRLESLTGWVWDSRAAAWDDGLSHLQRYLKETGSCLVPNEYKTADGFALRTWVKVQRRNKDSMSLERRRRLEEMKGWVWKVER